MTKWNVNWAIAAGIGVLALGATQAPYVNDFEKSAEGSVPDEMMVLNGSFGVKKEGGNAFLELPGEPLESFGFMAGPEDPAPNLAGARIWGDVTGKRFPEFGVGLRGAGGFKLWVMPIVGEVHIRKGDQVVAREKFAWKPGAWTTLRFRIRSEGEKQVVEGKAWQEGNEPEKPVIRWEGTGFTGGRASVWGVPFSGKPIRFDDVVVQ